jgi:hypothetical protein
VNHKPTDTDNPALSKALDNLQKLAERAEKGDSTAMPALREMMQKVPAVVDLLGGNLAQQAEASFVRAAAGENLAFKEALTRKLQHLRDELAGPNPTPLERLLVERVVACWLQVQDADVRCAQAKEPSIRWAEYLQRRMTHAHKRYLSAVKALAVVRKLAVPVLQVNIARKQVNVAAGCAVGEADVTQG